MAKQWVWVAVGAVAVGASAARCSDTEGTASAPSPTLTPTPSVVSTPPVTPKPWYEDYDPARFAVQVRKYAGQAGIRPQLLMAILYNESYKPHDPELERSWAKIDSDPAFGIANMHRPAFDDTKRGRAFAGRKWEELPDDPSLAIQAAAWHLHDLAKRLPVDPVHPVEQGRVACLGLQRRWGQHAGVREGQEARPAGAVVPRPPARELGQIG